MITHNRYQVTVTTSLFHATDGDLWRKVQQHTVKGDMHVRFGGRAYGAKVAVSFEEQHDHQNMTPDFYGTTVHSENFYLH